MINDSEGQLRKPINIVWFKKDLRIHDHLPLKTAIEDGLPLLLIYVLEPSIKTSPDWNIRHWQFVFHSIKSINLSLEKFHTQVHTLMAEAQDVFEFLMQKYEVKNVYSYQETGIRLTYDRDVDIGKLFKKKGVLWIESQNNGVIRGLKNRQTWDDAWVDFMDKCLEEPNLKMLKPIDFEVEIPFYIEYKLNQRIQIYPKNFQPPGEKFALQYLKGFINTRGQEYTKNLSKPENSRTSCSRISPYLSWGNMSVRQVYQLYKSNLGYSPFKRDLQNFRSRLQWRCHFIQKFEMEERMEFEPINRAYEILDQPLNETYIEAWQEAKTGYPLVDACMRCVKETGYLNFRMRAMIVSFLTHHLWQNWLTGVHFLAEQFLDYEPGIHFSQFQMQAGITGSNTIRIYNPIKQSQDHDSESIFIKKWMPELSLLPSSLTHQPWKMTQIEQSMYHCRIGIDYPGPIVDINKASNHAKKILWETKNSKWALEEKKRILAIHVKPKEKKDESLNNNI
jgi:deoxyribodipyrimidine photo-lyase